MDKESIFELQKIDCNCSDCKFMSRDVDKFKLSLLKHKKWQKDHFDNEVSKVIEKANEWVVKGDKDKFNNLIKESKRMRFVFDKKTVSINYGYCSILSKDVSFIPNTCQLETQDCFEHRRS